jgi:hypothetical protein
MALLKGRLLAGALFAGALFSSDQAVDTPVVIAQPPLIKRRSGLGSLKITPRVLPQYNPDLEEVFEPETTITEKPIRAKSKRDEFLILH